MPYFSQFPTFLAKIGDRQKLVEDFFVRVAPGKNYTSSSVLLLSTFILDGERPEDVAYRFYKNAEYHWVILLANNIVDPREEWPLPNADVYTFATRRYGVLNDVHHYRTVQGHHIISGYSQLLSQGIIEPVTNIEHELEVNEAKRHIKVLDPQFLNEFVSDLQNQINV